MRTNMRNINSQAEFDQALKDGELEVEITADITIQNRSNITIWIKTGKPTIENMNSCKPTIVNSGSCQPTIVNYGANKPIIEEHRKNLKVKSEVKTLSDFTTDELLAEIKRRIP